MTSNNTTDLIAENEYVALLRVGSWPTAAIRVVENYAYCIAAFDVGAAIPLTQIRIAACDPQRNLGKSQTKA